MIGFLRGQVCLVQPDRLLMDVNGIGYNVMISSADAGKMPSRGSEVKVYTYLSVREDAIKLFGFLDSESLDFFKLLIGVGGIGPKVALGILGAKSVDVLKLAIISQDKKTISQCPGVGAKMASKIILELKDKVDSAELLPGGEITDDGDEAGSFAGNTPQMEAAEALAALGFSRAEAFKFVGQVKDSDTMGVEEIIKAALKFAR